MMVWFHQVVKKLLAEGATSDSRCKWTDMTALHYATYFDVGPVVTTLLTATKVIVQSVCCIWKWRKYSHHSAVALESLCKSIEERIELDLVQSLFVTRSFPFVASVKFYVANWTLSHHTSAVASKHCWNSTLIKCFPENSNLFWKHGNRLTPVYFFHRTRHYTK